jgi:hypothetical protein
MFGDIVDCSGNGFGRQNIESERCDIGCVGERRWELGGIS